VLAITLPYKPVMFIYPASNKASENLVETKSVWRAVKRAPAAPWGG